MYAINLNTVNMGDVIARSLVCHPSLLCENIRETMRIHIRFANTTRDAVSRGIAIGMADTLQRYAVAIDNRESVDDIMRKVRAPNGFGARVMLFHMAARLQVLPHATQVAIAKREDVAT